MATWPTTTPVKAGGLVPSWLDCLGEAVSRVRSHISPGPYRSFRELSLAGSVDPVIWCPPTFVGNSGIECFNGDRGLALLFCRVRFCCARACPRRLGRITEVSGILGHPLCAQLRTPMRSCAERRMTAEGYCIGYGAGHYDYTLEHLRKAKAIIAIGTAFAVQEIKAVPAQPHDVALDYVLTEKKVFDFRS